MFFYGGEIDVDCVLDGLIVMEKKEVFVNWFRCIWYFVMKFLCDGDYVVDIVVRVVDKLKNLGKLGYCFMGMEMEFLGYVYLKIWGSFFVNW